MHLSFRHVLECYLLFFVVKKLLLHPSLYPHLHAGYLCEHKAFLSDRLHRGFLVGRTIRRDTSERSSIVSSSPARFQPRCVDHFPQAFLVVYFDFCPRFSAIGPVLSKTNANRHGHHASSTRPISLRRIFTLQLDILQTFPYMQLRVNYNESFVLFSRRLSFADVRFNTFSGSSIDRLIIFYQSKNDVCFFADCV